MMPFELIQAYRAETYRSLPALRIHSQEQAVDFVNERGFVFFWPIEGLLLPSLWVAVAGDRRVADQHDDPGHITWDWKDTLLGGRAWYYAKVLRKKATMISFALLPCFYALSENYGSPEEDYLTLYEQGRLTQEAKMIYEALLDQGPLDTIELRKAARMSSPLSESRFERALADLQADFKVLPVGVAHSGGWHYAFIYQVVPRQYPELPDQAHSLSEDQARQRLVQAYFRSVGAAQAQHVSKLFGWRAPGVSRALEALVHSGWLQGGVKVEKQPGEWFVMSELAGSP
jgi:hypothetical protein